MEKNLLQQAGLNSASLETTSTTEVQNLTPTIGFKNEYPFIEGYQFRGEILTVREPQFTSEVQSRFLYDDSAYYTIKHDSDITEISIDGVDHLVNYSLNTIVAWKNGTKYIINKDYGYEADGNKDLFFIPGFAKEGAKMDPDFIQDLLDKGHKKNYAFNANIFTAEERLASVEAGPVITIMCKDHTEGDIFKCSAGTETYYVFIAARGLTIREYAIKI